MTSSDRLREKVQAAVARREELGRQLASPEVISDPARLKELAREHSGLERLAEVGGELVKLDDQLEQAEDRAARGRGP
jgi:protein subunit release factor A